MTRTTFRIVSLAVMAFALAGCDLGGPSNTDSGIDADSLTGMNAGIWVDGDGCDHWIIDDGLEGYMTPRFGPDRKPLCRPGAVPYSTINFQRSVLGSS